MTRILRLDEARDAGGLLVTLPTALTTFGSALPIAPPSGQARRTLECGFGIAFRLTLELARFWPSKNFQITLRVSLSTKGSTGRGSHITTKFGGRRATRLCDCL